MKFDIKRLGLGDRIAGIAAIVLFIDLYFIDWFGFKGCTSAAASALGINCGANGWRWLSIQRWLLLLLLIITIGHIVRKALGQRPYNLGGISVPAVITGLAGLETILLLYRGLLNEPGPDNFVDQKLGVFIGIITVGAITYGGYLMMRAEGTTVGHVVGQARGAAGRARDAVQSGGDQQQGGGAPPGWGAEGGPPAQGGGAPAPGGGAPAQAPAAQPAATQAGGGAAPAAGGSPKADWYPDPKGEARLRYWDGSKWTEHTAQ